MSQTTIDNREELLRLVDTGDGNNFFSDGNLLKYILPEYNGHNFLCMTEVHR